MVLGSLVKGDEAAILRFYHIFSRFTRPLNAELFIQFSSVPSIKGEKPSNGAFLKTVVVVVRTFFDIATARVVNRFKVFPFNKVFFRFVSFAFLVLLVSDVDLQCGFVQNGKVISKSVVNKLTPR
jgi:hypothetical protein